MSIRQTGRVGYRPGWKLRRDIFAGRKENVKWRGVGGEVGRISGMDVHLTELGFLIGRAHRLKKLDLFGGKQNALDAPRFD